MSVIRSPLSEAHGAPVAPDNGPRTADHDQDERIYTTVEAVFRAEINPMVARHGGKVELVDVQDATVVVRMRGGCQGCGMATVTLRQGIETALRHAVPGIRGLRDITDHAAGSNPYYQP